MKVLIDTSILFTALDPMHSKHTANLRDFERLVTEDIVFEVKSPY